MVHPVQGNFTLPPICTEYYYGLNEGKCVPPLPPQSDYNIACSVLGEINIPLSYIGTREVCATSSGKCTTEGPNGPGLPNTDYLFFISAPTCKFSLFTVAIRSSYIYIAA